MKFAKQYPALLSAINTAQSGYVSSERAFDLFNRMLDNVLLLTNSEYGFIGEIKENSSQRYLKTHAITNIAWDETTRNFYEENVESGLEFLNLNTLFGYVIRTGENIIVNAPKECKEAGGIPKGHPPLNAFLGVAIYHGKHFIGMMGIANRAEGYDQDLLDFIQPLIKTCGNIIWGFRLEHERNEVRHLLASSQFNLLEAQRIAKLGNWHLNLDSNDVQCSKQALINFGFPTFDTNIPFSKLLSQLSESDQSSLNQFIHQIENHKQAGSIVLTVPNKITNNSRVIELQAEKNTQEAIIAGIVIDISDRYQLEQLKDQFISTVSHELRTPLTSIRGSIGLLLNQTDNMTDEQLKLARITANNTDRLLDLVNDLLDINKLEAGAVEMDLNCIKLEETINKSIDLNQSFGKLHKVEFKLIAEEDMNVLIDKTRFVQILTNLLSNAAKFSGDSTCVYITLKRHDRYARILVEDNGIGVAPEFRKKLFTRFQQSDSSSTRSAAGTGLGLAISKSLVELMGGKIGYMPSDKMGSIFYFDVPLCIP